MPALLLARRNRIDKPHHRDGDGANLVKISLHHPQLQSYIYGDTSLIRTIPFVDPTVALSLGTYGDPRGVGVSYERGTPVAVNNFGEVVGPAPA